MSLGSAVAGEMSSSGGHASMGGKMPLPTSIKVTQDDDRSIFDTIWGIPTLIEDAGPINELSLIGRYHGQYHVLDADDLGDDSDWDNRRWRAGFAAELFDAVELEVQFNLDEDADRFVKNLEDVYLGIALSDSLDLALGKMKPDASREYNTSSKRIKTIERSLLANQVAPNKIWGANLSGECGEFGWELGAYAGDLDGDWNFSEFNAGYLYNAAVSFGDVKVSYLYNDGDEGNNGASDYDGVASVSYVNYGKKGYDGVGLFAEAIYANGDSDAYGVTLMPSYMLTEQLEVVLRYHLAASDDDSGLRLQKRYDRAADNLGTDDGDLYHGIYGGLNYYINSDKLKVMAGVEYSNMDLDDGDSYSGVTFLGGVRIYF